MRWSMQLPTPTSLTVLSLTPQSSLRTDNNRELLQQSTCSSSRFTCTCALLIHLHHLTLAPEQGQRQRWRQQQQQQQQRRSGIDRLVFFAESSMYTEGGQGLRARNLYTVGFLLFRFPDVLTT